MRKKAVTNRVTHVFELKDKSGAVSDVIQININIEEIAAEFERRRTDLIDAERGLKLTQKKGNEPEFDKAAEVYANATLSFLELIFDEEGAAKLLAFFDARYFDMALAVAPLVKKRIIPAIKKLKAGRINASKKIYL